MEKKSELTREELEIIGRTRYKNEHGKGMVTLTLVCYAVSALLAILLMKLLEGYIYVFGLAPAAIPLYLNLKLENEATKEGKAFADNLERK
jgi:hypothetical protein